MIILIIIIINIITMIIIDRGRKDVRMITMEGCAVLEGWTRISEDDVTFSCAVVIACGRQPLPQNMKTNVQQFKMLCRCSRNENAMQSTKLECLRSR
jgi:hypothetical protein